MTAEPSGNPDVSGVFVKLSVAQRRRAAVRRADRARFRAHWERVGHRTWRQYYKHVRQEGGPATAFFVATVAYTLQTLRLG